MQAMPAQQEPLRALFPQILAVPSGVCPLCSSPGGRFFRYTPRLGGSCSHIGNVLGGGRQGCRAAFGPRGGGSTRVRSSRCQSFRFPSRRATQPGCCFSFRFSRSGSGGERFSSKQAKSTRDLEEKNKSREWEGQRGCDPWVLNPGGTVMGWAKAAGSPGAAGSRSCSGLCSIALAASCTFRNPETCLGVPSWL